MIDLGEWANDGYRIEGEPGSADRMSPEELDAAADRARELEERQRPPKPTAPAGAVEIRMQSGSSFTVF